MGLGTTYLVAALARCKRLIIRNNTGLRTPQVPSPFSSISCHAEQVPDHPVTNIQEAMELFDNLGSISEENPVKGGYMTQHLDRLTIFECKYQA